MDLQFNVRKRRLDADYFKPAPSECAFLPEYVTTGLCELTVKTTTAHFHLARRKPNFCTLGHPGIGRGDPRGSGYVKAPDFLDVRHYKSGR